jgi:hypothetical protein
MMGNHDTPPIAAVLDAWRERGEVPKRVRYLAARLAPGERQRAGLAERLEREPGALVTAMLADLFIGPARNVQVFWADLFGERRVYNRPGVVDPANWTLRVPPDFERARTLAVARGDAPSVERALAWALAARGLGREGLQQALDLKPASPAAPERS